MRRVEVGTFSAGLGALLTSVREEGGLSQEALAVQLQRDQSYVSRIESGGRHASVLYLLEFAVALDIPFDDLARRIEAVWKQLRER